MQPSGTDRRRIRSFPTILCLQSPDWKDYWGCVLFAACGARRRAIVSTRLVSPSPDPCWTHPSTSQPDLLGQHLSLFPLRFRSSWMTAPGTSRLTGPCQGFPPPDDASRAPGLQVGNNTLQPPARLCVHPPKPSGRRMRSHSLPPSDAPVPFRAGASSCHPRPCGAVQSASGPMGMMRCGFTMSWLK